MDKDKYFAEVVMPDVVKSGSDRTSIIAVDCKNWEELNTAWRHFRSTDAECIKYFGVPDWPTPDIVPDARLTGLFSKFLLLNTPGRATMPLFIRATFPNGDEFYIRRLRGEELEQFAPTKFLCLFMDFSRVGGAFLQYTLDIYNDVSDNSNSVILRICSTPNVFVAKDFGDVAEYFDSV